MTHESIADRLVFNRTLRGNLRAGGSASRKGTPSIGVSASAWGPGGHSQRETKNTRPAKRNICRRYTPGRIEINVTAARPSAEPAPACLDGWSNYEDEFRFAFFDRLGD
jgi:hypothetical protein